MLAYIKPIYCLRTRTPLPMMMVMEVVLVVVFLCPAKSACLHHLLKGQRSFLAFQHTACVFVCEREREKQFRALNWRFLPCLLVAQRHSVRLWNATLTPIDKICTQTLKSNEVFLISFVAHITGSHSTIGIPFVDQSVYKYFSIIGMDLPLWWVQP